jgi:hypothetical protein
LRSADAFQGLFPIICNDCSGLVADRIFRAHHQVLMPECLLLAALPAHLSVQLGPRRWYESAWCLLGFAGGNGFNQADRAGFRHVFSDPHCLFSTNALLFHFSFRLWPAASEGKEQHRTACNG